MKIIKLIVVFTLLAGCSSESDFYAGRQYVPHLFKDTIQNANYISSPLTISDLEKIGLTKHKDWKEFKNKFEKGDKIFEIRSGAVKDGIVYGWNGYIIVRGELVIWDMATKIIN